MLHSFTRHHLPPPVLLNNETYCLTTLKISDADERSSAVLDADVSFVERMKTLTIQALQGSVEFDEEGRRLLSESSRRPPLPSPARFLGWKSAEISQFMEIMWTG